MKKITTLFFLLITFSFISAYTTVSSNISTNTTWTSGTYYISTSIDVNSGIILTINPGVVVKFAHGARMYVPGTIDANGSDLTSNYVVFTSMDDDIYGETISGSDGIPNPGDWQGLYGYGEGGHQGTIQLDYTILRYGGNASGPDGNLYWYKGSGYFRNGICEYSATNGIHVIDVYVSVENSLIRNNAGNGVYIYENLVNSNISVNNNVFTNNTGYAAHIIVNRFSNINNNSGSGNGVNGFALAGHMNGNQTITGYNNSFPLIMLGQISVDQSNTLTLPASTIIKSESDGYLYVSGTLNVNGESNNAVVFTSYKDDTYGGDTYNDGSSTSPAAGDWKGILVTNSGNYSTSGGVGTFNYAIIRYGGNSSTNFDANVGITVSAYATTFTGCVIENSANYGIYLTQAYLKVRSSRITNNGTYGIYGYSGVYAGGINLGDYSLDNGNNRITGNGTNAIYNDGYSILAEANYWGVTTNSEIAALITNTSGSVDYDPWLTSDPTAVPTPVELTSFSANKNGNFIELNWQTATEVNNYGFSVERKTENAKWEEITFVNGHGNSNSPKEYSFIDSDNLSGVVQYRLKQIDTDGSFEYSEIIEVIINLPTEFKLSQNYPNPFNPSTTIQFALPKAGVVSLKIYNILGEEVATLINREMNAGFQSINFDASNISSGLYFYRIKAGNFVDAKKMLLLK